MQIKVYPYKMSSKSARLLARGLNAIRVYPDRNYRPKANHMIINWGNSTRPDWYDTPVSWAEHQNDQIAVANAIDKLTTFQKFSLNNVPHPEWTCDTEVAQAWIDQDFKVYGRKVLRGHSGQGIIIFENETITSDKVCPLYTKSTKAKHEFRIHVGNNGETIIDMVQKKKRAGYEGGIPGIRNHSNGWVFARQDISVPTKVIEAAKQAIKALALDFGAVDVGYHEQTDKAFVYEVNTAPGLEGTTLQRYIEYFRSISNA